MTLKSDDLSPHAHSLRAGRISAPWEIYCVTKCISDRRALLASPAAAEAVIDCLAFVRRQGRIKLLAFVIMPDHYHALFVLLPGAELSDVMKSIGSFSSRQIRTHFRLEGTIWQEDGFHDRRCRSEAEAREYAEYLHHNPVRKGLVAVAEDWPFSSAHPRRRALLDWD
jgi:REP element-mobilizing transposase RayT